MTNYEVYGLKFIIPILFICVVSFLLFINLHTKKDTLPKELFSHKKIQKRTFIKIISLATFIFTLTLLLFQISSKAWIFQNVGEVSGSEINTQLYNAAQIVIPTIGVVLTGIFSYLIYHSTEKTVNITSDLYYVEKKRDREKENEKLEEEIENYRTYLITRINTLVDLENKIWEWEFQLKNDNAHLVASEMDKKYHNLFTAGQDIYDRYTVTYKSVRISLIINELEEEEYNKFESLKKDVSELRSASLNMYRKYFPINKGLSYKHKELLRQNNGRFY